MKIMDCVEVTVEKDKYVRDGVHKGMQGWICDDRCIQNCWLVNFPQCGEKDDIATISVNEEDLMEIPSLLAKVNEEIKEQFDYLNQKAAPISDEDNSSYLV
mgnify:FL=1